jgi:hypothetical protein
MCDFEVKIWGVADAFDFPTGVQELFPSGGCGEGVQDVTFVFGESQGMNDRVVGDGAALVVIVVAVFFCVDDGGRRRRRRRLERWWEWGRRCFLCILLRARWLRQGLLLLVLPASHAPEAAALLPLLVLLSV